MSVRISTGRQFLSLDRVVIQYCVWNIRSSVCLEIEQLRCSVCKNSYCTVQRHLSNNYGVVSVRIHTALFSGSFQGFLAFNQCMFDKIHHIENPALRRTILQKQCSYKYFISVALYTLCSYKYFISVALYTLCSYKYFNSVALYTLCSYKYFNSVALYTLCSYKYFISVALYTLCSCKYFISVALYTLCSCKYFISVALYTLRPIATYFPCVNCGLFERIVPFICSYRSSCKNCNSYLIICSVAIILTDR